MPYDAKAIANFFIELANAEAKPLTPMKLQKLVYYAHGWHFGLTGRPLLDEAVQAWSYGPVIMSLYKAFTESGAGPITQPALNYKLLPGTLQMQVHRPSIEDFPTEDKEFVKRLLKQVWKIYGDFTAYQLSNMTHAAGTPWGAHEQNVRWPHPQVRHDSG